MGSSPILAVDEDIDDHIRTFCLDRRGLQPNDIVRDIARIVCIVDLVRTGVLDGDVMALCGGMAMRGLVVLCWWWEGTRGSAANEAS